MELNDTEYLLNPALFTDSVTIEDKFSTEYLLNESLGVENKKADDEQISSKNFDILPSPLTTPVKEDIESILINQDASIIQTHSAINSLSGNYTNGDELELEKNTIKTFLKIFENYCYFIRYYEYQLYLSNQDKYIRFLIHLFAKKSSNFFETTEDLNMFIEIVRTFVNEPTNIYMRLSKKVLDKDNTMKASIIWKWNRRSKIYKTSDLINQDSDDEVKKNVFMDMINKIRITEFELLQTERKFLLKSFIKRYFNLWKEKKKLTEHYVYFGNELIRERFFKESIYSNWRKILLHKDEADMHMHKVVKKKAFEKLWLQREINNEAKDKQETFTDYNLKVKYTNNLKQKHSLLETLNEKKDMKLKTETLRQLIFQARLGRQADMVYFGLIKRNCLELLQKKLTLKQLEERFAGATKTRYFKILLKRIRSLDKDEKFAVNANRNLIKKRLLNCLKIKYEMDTKLMISADKKAVSTVSSVRTAFDKWRMLVSNIKYEKLMFYEKIYNNEVAVPVAKETVYRHLLSSYMKLKTYEEEGEKLQVLNDKKNFFNAAKKALHKQNAQFLRLASYKSQNVRDAYLNKWRMSLNVVESHDELVLAFLNKRTVTDLSKILYNWNLKVMRNESMNTPLLTHRKRWRRAQLRGVLGVWMEKQRLKEAELVKRAIKTPFKQHDSQKAFNGTVERRNVPHRLFLEETPFVGTPINQNIYSSEFKTSKIREKKELLENFTPHSRFSKDLLRPSPVKKQILKTRMESMPSAKDEINSKEYKLSNNSKDNRYFRNKISLDDASFSTPFSTNSNLRYKTHVSPEIKTSIENSKKTFLPPLK